MTEYLLYLEAEYSMTECNILRLKMTFIVSEMPFERKEILTKRRIIARLSPGKEKFKYVQCSHSVVIPHHFPLD
jgi:hypothetical protein